MAHSVRNELITDALSRGLSPILPFETDTASDLLRNLNAKQEELGATLGDAMRQSSETWHDNAPADAINAESKTVTARALRTINILTNAVVIDYTATEEDGATLGSLVTIYYDADDMEEVMITGSVRELPNDIDELVKKNATPDIDLSIITVGSPLGIALLGKRPGERAEFAVNGRTTSVGIVDVKQYQTLA